MHLKWHSIVLSKHTVGTWCWYCAFLWDRLGVVTSRAGEERKQLCSLRLQWAGLGPEGGHLGRFRGTAPNVRAERDSQDEQSPQVESSPLQGAIRYYLDPCFLGIAQQWFTYTRLSVYPGVSGCWDFSPVETDLTLPGCWDPSLFPLPRWAREGRKEDGVMVALHTPILGPQSWVGGWAGDRCYKLGERGPGGQRTAGRS